MRRERGYNSDSGGVGGRGKVEGGREWKQLSGRIAWRWKAEGIYLFKRAYVLSGAHLEMYNINGKNAIDSSKEWKRAIIFWAVFQKTGERDTSSGVGVRWGGNEKFWKR